MKKVLTCVAMALLFIGCVKEYNDSALREEIAALKTRVTELESNMDAIQSVIGNGVFVAKVQEYTDPDTGKITGITVTYTNGDVKHFEISPKADYAGPVLGVITNGAGELVWAIDGIAIKDADGNEVPVNKTPVFSIDEDGNLWVEIDGKKTNLGIVTTGGATLEDGIFTDIKVEADKIVLTLSDGSKVNIPFAEAFKLNIETTSYTFSALDAIEIPYTVSAKTAGTVVGVAGYSPREFSVAVEADKIVVTPLQKDAAAILLAYADSKVGLTSIVNITVEAEGVEVVDEPYSTEVDYMAEGEEGSVEAHIVSNITPEVKPVDSWIHVVSVKAKAYTITLSLDDNTTGAVRTGKVNIFKSGTESLVQTITIAQAASTALPYTNLSKNGVANSYIITAPGEYMFAAVKGNTIESVGTVAKAEVLWETHNNSEPVTAGSIIAKAQYAGGYIFITTPATLTPGNALVAAKDADGKILWSWHIWAPATEIGSGTYGFSATMMDRNLGALKVADETVADSQASGLFYQWGRKDPLRAVGSLTVKGNATTAPAEVWTSVAEAVSLEVAKQNPTVMYTINPWTSDAHAGLWAADKGINDPCPAGWKVPDNSGIFEGYWDFTKYDAWVWGQYGVRAGTTEAGTTVFPFSGYAYYSSGSYDFFDSESSQFTGTRLWTIVAYSTADTYRALQMKKDQTRSGSGQKMGNGHAIRCVVDNGEPVLPPKPGEGPSDEPGDEPGDQPGDEPGNQPGTGVTDLSASASANCYVINAAGEYKFKTVKGNGSDSVGTVDKAELVWETYNNGNDVTVNSVIAAVSYADGYITFSTPENKVPGNALIAAKDADGKILWSWHIWIPATEIAVDAFGNIAASTVMMDRNLGALVAATTEAASPAESCGMYYQWGRKDPFVGAKNLSSSYPGAAKVAGTEWQKVDNTALTVTVDTGIENPTNLYYKDTVSESDWLTESIDNLWDAQKTIYDPCPAGYKVPAYDSSKVLWTQSQENWNFDFENLRYTHSSSSAVFPMAGLVDSWGGGISNVGLESFIWSATKYSAGGNRAWCIYVRKSKDPNFYYYPKYYKAVGGSVRCVAE